MQSYFGTKGTGQGLSTSIEDLITFENLDRSSDLVSPVPTDRHWETRESSEQKAMKATITITKRYSHKRPIVVDQSPQRKRRRLKRRDAATLDIQGKEICSDADLKLILSRLTTFTKDPKK